MTRTYTQSPAAARSLELVRSLQAHFVATLEAIDRAGGASQGMQRVEWLREGGTCGGGDRFCNGGSPVFGRASVNVSQVHYDGQADKKLGSATALSAIVHPANPYAPSIHLHVSWTEYKSGEGYWRIMADLNPSLPEDEQTERFEAALRAAAPEHFAKACEEGERYFWIPSLERHRGVAHFYLEGFRSEKAAADEDLARRVARAAIDVYGELVRGSVQAHGDFGEDECDAQLAYHTVYLFQVLTLDRGTTAGLLVHDENDLGILGSLPARVDTELLGSWEAGVAAPQDKLVALLVAALGKDNPATVDDAAKQRLAQVLREHYKRHPEALELQASAAQRPPSIENHD